MGGLRGQFCLFPVKVGVTRLGFESVIFETVISYFFDLVEYHALIVIVSPP